MNFKPVFTENEKRFDLRFHEKRAEVQVGFGEVQTVTKLVGDPYNGDYTVRPLVEPQTLETKHKIMTDDLTILEIPYAEVTNTSGGMTATIG